MLDYTCMLLINIMLSRFLILMQRKSDPWLLPTIINVLIVLEVINSISWLRRTTSIIIYNFVHCAMVLIAKGYPFLHLACTIGSRYIIMLILPCTVPFRISCNFYIMLQIPCIILKLIPKIIAKTVK